MTSEVENLRKYAKKMDASLSFIALGKIKKTLLEVPIKADGSEIETGNIFHFKRQD